MKKLHNDKGFSLIEVLIAVAILAIVSLPILKAFSSSAGLNAKARREENAGTAASAVAENFKSLSLAQLKKLYDGQYTYDESDGSYVFHVTDSGVDYFQGVNGEEFEIQVTLDPSPYKNGGADDTNTANNINSFVTPTFNSLNSTRNIVIRDQIYQWDSDAVNTFCIQTGATSATAKENVARGTVRDIELTITISLDEIDGLTGNATFTQKVSGTVTYTYNGCPDYVRKFIREGKVENVPKEAGYYNVNSDTGVRNIYVFYTPYDIYTTDGSGNKATDTMTINYVYQTDASVNINYDDLGVYIVQQDMYTKTYNTKVELDTENITLKVNGNTILKSYDGTIGLPVQGTGTSRTNSGPIDFYSNITGWSGYRMSEDTVGNGITSTATSAAQDYLYSMNIKIWQDKDSRISGEEPIIDINSTKEN